MTRYIALFRDAVDPNAVAPEVSAAHFSYLEQHRDQIVLAGGLRPDAGQPFCGALWIIEAADRVTAERLVDHDPYRQHTIWSAPEIFAWGKAPGYGTVQL